MKNLNKFLLFVFIICFNISLFAAGTASKQKGVMLLDAPWELNNLTIIFAFQQFLQFSPQSCKEIKDYPYDIFIKAKQHRKLNVFETDYLSKLSLLRKKCKAYQTYLNDVKALKNGFLVGATDRKISFKEYNISIIKRLKIKNLKIIDSKGKVHPLNGCKLNAFATLVEKEAPSLTISSFSCAINGFKILTPFLPSTIRYSNTNLFKRTDHWYNWRRSYILPPQSRIELRYGDNIAFFKAIRAPFVSESSKFPVE